MSRAALVALVVVVAMVSARAMSASSTGSEKALGKAAKDPAVSVELSEVAPTPVPLSDADIDAAVQLFSVLRSAMVLSASDVPDLVLLMTRFEAEVANVRAASLDEDSAVLVWVTNDSWDNKPGVCQTVVDRVNGTGTTGCTPTEGLVGRGVMALSITPQDVGTTIYYLLTDDEVLKLNEHADLVRNNAFSVTLPVGEESRGEPLADLLAAESIS